jgi:hypothetical protein
MKRIFLAMTACAIALCASASNRYVSPTGNDGDGKSWANAKTTIAGAIWDVGVGDTMFIAEGVYGERLSTQNGATYLGGYNAETGVRDIEVFETILDGTDLGNSDRLVTKYDNPPASPIVIDGLILQNNNFQYEGGAVNIRANMTLSNCVIRNCEGSSGGAIYVVSGGGAQPVIRNCKIISCKARSSYGGAIYNKGGLIDHCVIELCESKSHGGAIYNKEGGVVENTIIRGCGGKYGAISNQDSCIVRNCVFHNNAATVAGWPDAGGVYVPDGNTKSQVINCTFANNYGNQYAGSYIGGGTVYNNVFWGNKAPDSFTEHVNKISSSATKGNNVTDDGSSSEFMSVSLNKDNTDAAGPNFRNPSSFVGIPTNANEITIMRQADFSLTNASVALLDKADASKAPEKDLEGVVRTIGEGADIGAYEYDPNATTIAVTGVTISPATLTMSVGSKGTLLAQVEPANANNKRVIWSIEDPTIATIDKGKVIGVSEGTTTAWVETEDGGFTASATIIVKPVKYPQEVLDAEATYQIEDYTIPSFIPFLVAKTEAKIDSVDPEADITIIAEKLVVMNQRISELQPKEQPYNQIATFNGDPATNMGFCWFTNGGITNGVVQLLPMANATADDFASVNGVLTFSANTQNAQLHYTPIQASESPKYDICTAAGLPRNTKFNYVSHKAIATNLTPGTTYSWRVGFDGHWSEIGQFVTKAENQGNFSFIYMTDSHIQDAEYIEQARQCANAVVQHETDAKFCLFPGDFVDTGGATNSEWQWERWFEGSMRPALNKMAFVPTDGNHDDSPSLNYDYHFNTDWGFANGAEVKPQFKGITYSFQYGDVLFMVFSMQDWWRESGTHESEMHSKYFTQDLRNWFLDQIEAHPTAKYRVTLSHKNIFSGAGHHTDDESTLIRTLMLPIFKECEIDLAIQGHDHCYEVIGPVNPDTKTVIPGSVTDTVRLYPEMKKRYDRSSNATGLEGGTFTTNDGALYFIGATCGRKRYEPYSRADMDAEYTTNPSLLFDYKHHNVENLFDLFTSKFGQPGTPSWTRFNVTSEGIEVITYYLDKNTGAKTVFNTINVKRTRPHGTATGLENTSDANISDGEKFIRNGQIFIRKNGRTFNMLGEVVE